MAAIEAADGFVSYRKGGWGQDTLIARRLREWLGNDYFLAIDSVSYYVSNAEKLDGLSAYHRAVTDARLESISWYFIYGEPEAVEVLHKLGGVRRLHYSGRMTVDVMRRIGEFPLESLVLQGNDFSNQSIRHLASLQELKQLDLGTDKPDRMIPYIAQLKSLERLSFIMSDTLGAAEIRELRTLTKLKSLKFFSGYPPNFIQAIAEQFPALEELGLWNIDDPAVVAPLATHPSLKFIEILGGEYQHTATIEKLLPRVTVGHFYE